MPTHHRTSLCPASVSLTGWPSMKKTLISRNQPRNILAVSDRMQYAISVPASGVEAVVNTNKARAWVSGCLGERRTPIEAGREACKAHAQGKGQCAGKRGTRVGVGLDEWERAHVGRRFEPAKSESAMSEPARVRVVCAGDSNVARHAPAQSS